MKINNESEYQAAMQRLDYLVENDPNNLAEIVALGNEVNDYENDNGHAPVHPDSLIARIEREMYKRHLSKGQLAELLEVPASRLSEILHGKRSVNLDFAKRLYKKLGIPAEFILEAV
ncbi:helix-turn-helix domain-containing protein [uncultured Hymenobacter sp.]|uniref:helix-turn-helix domain-containing protein n=1 Tax=uncultured Hymenobacter sp. TaxID=170016 RepID=UPI0035CC48C2